MSDELDLMTAILGDGSNICLSGGADGADLQWGMCAGMAGHKVIHWSFDSHKTRAPDVEVVRLSSEQLERANDAIAKAANGLKRRVPHKWFVKPLIQRNWYQVNWSDSVFAVCDFENGKPTGGTAWAIQMYLDRDINHRAHLFDQNSSQWYSWNDALHAWVHTPSTKPTLHLHHDFLDEPKGIWAGIGTRNLKQNGKEAIRKLMGYVKPVL